MQHETCNLQSNIRKQVKIVFADKEELIKHSLRLCRQDCLTLLHIVREEIATLRVTVRSGRSRLWTTWVQEQMKKGSTGKAAVVNRLRKTPHAGASLVQQADGTFVGNAEEIDELLHKAWDPIFCKYSACEEPDWEAFRDQYAHRCTLTQSARKNEERAGLRNGGMAREGA
eukprot:11791979-Karenia_brevis.AAC.1